MNKINWDERFKIQATWTNQFRSHILNNADVKTGERVLDVGCGTGVIINEMFIQDGYEHLYGIDINLDFLTIASQKLNNIHLINCDAYSLPFQSKSFDACICHYFLLWVNNPLQILLEMKRITRRYKPLIIMAEPDYGGRIDYPDDLSELGVMQTQSLRDQGADPHFGRKLRGLLSQINLFNINVGIMGHMWSNSPSQLEIQSEMEIANHDNSDRLLSSRTINNLINVDKQAWKQCSRILFVPTFYAWGFVR